MSLTAPLLLIITSLFFIALNRRRRSAVAILVSCAILVLLIGSGLLTRLALDGLQDDRFVSQPDWHSNNLIVLLGAGTAKWSDQAGTVRSSVWGNSRILEAARLYFDCQKFTHTCKVLASGGDAMANGISEAEAMTHALEDLGVPIRDLQQENLSRNTFQNAKFSREFILTGKFDQVYLVTSGFHMRRARLYFSHFKITTLAAPADRLQAILSLVPLPFNFIYFDIALHEYGGILQFHLYNFLGWNRPVE